MVIFRLQVLKGAEDAKRKKRLSLDEIKQKLVESFIFNDTVENDELKKKADEVEKPEKAAEVTKECENIIKTNKKGIVRVAYYQGKVFKNLKNKEKFSTLVNQWKIHKTTIVFKINIYKLCERFPKLLNSSVGLGFLKTISEVSKKFVWKMKKSFLNSFALVLAGV